MRTVAGTYENHAAAILAILNDAIVESAALYDCQPRTPESMAAWFNARSAGGFPVICMEDDTGQLAGFATYANFRAGAGYTYAKEHSVYVHKDHRGKGLGVALMRLLIEAARDQQVHTLIGVIDGGNAVSIALHERLGFVLAGIIREAGFKFGQWRDVHFYQILLHTPAHPKASGRNTSAPMKYGRLRTNDN